MTLWKPTGRIIKPSDINAGWYRSHVQVPVVDTALEDRWRIYFSGRNEKGQSRILYADVRPGAPHDILDTCTEPVLPLGKPGTFDDSGTMPTHVMTVGNRKFLYYIGWTQKVTVPYQNAVGIAEIRGDRYEKLYEGPVIGMDHIDPYFTGTFYSLKIGDRFTGYYLSATEWVENPDSGKREAVYDIKSATSRDGVLWDKTGKVSLALEPEEGGLVSATVVAAGDNYLMWFARRGRFSFRESGSPENYELGVAVSSDGIDWKRTGGPNGLPPERGEWESNMRCYPYIVAEGDRLHLFYNGNGFGATGIAHAVCDRDALEHFKNEIDHGIND